ncbi:ABC transporter permease [Bordetella genomosp. 8]|nr:ABC transporter permease [Bordetella genomosp. 8]
MTPPERTAAAGTPPPDHPAAAATPPGTGRALSGTGKATKPWPWSGWLLVLPALAIFGVFVAALAALLAFSLYARGTMGGELSGGPTLRVYAQALSNPLYLAAIYTTFRLSAIATLGSLALGLPVAYWIVRSPSARLRTALIMLVAIPFMTSLIVRLYALTLVLGNTGLVNRVLHGLGILPENDFLPLIRNETSVAIGLVYFVLPFVIFTLAAGFRRYDRTLEEAAQNLGADEVSTFFRVTLPLLMPGIAAAGTLAFVLAGTAFATPLLLGGGAVRMIANAIYDRAMYGGGMPVAAALSALALLFTMACLYVAGRLTRRQHARTS